MARKIKIIVVGLSAVCLFLVIFVHETMIKELAFRRRITFEQFNRSRNDYLEYIPNLSLPQEERINFVDTYDSKNKLQQLSLVPKFRAPVNESAQRRLPNCIIIGVSKCGTRALLDYLGLNPYVVTASKEIDYFNKEINYQQGLSWYIENMPLSYSNQLTIEKSPDYFQCPKCPQRIYSMDPNIKLIVLLRDPVERLVSQYMQLVEKAKKLGFDIGTFDKWVKDPKTGTFNTKNSNVNISIYHLHLENWLRVFPRQQIHIVDGNRLISDPLSEIPAVEIFLGLVPFMSTEDVYFNKTKGFYCLRNRFTGWMRCLHASKGRPHVKVDNETLHMLYNFYSPHNARLGALIGYSMSWL